MSILNTISHLILTTLLVHLFISKDTYIILLSALLAAKSESKVLENDSLIHLAANHHF